MHKKREMSQGCCRLQTHQIQQAGTAVLIFGCKRNDTLLKPQRGFQSFTIIYSLFVPVPTKWISALVGWRAYKPENLLCM